MSAVSGWQVDSIGEARSMVSCGVIREGLHGRHAGGNNNK
jgi:hypothetical protein